jgi:superfamily II DNA or RNA helicase
MAQRRSWVPRRRYEMVPFDEVFSEDEWLDVARTIMHPPATAGPALPAPPPPTPHPRDWKQHVALVGEAMRPASAVADRRPREREILYMLDANPDRAQHGVTVEVFCRDRRASGAWSPPRPLKLRWHEIAALLDPADQKILSLLAAASDPYGSWPAYRSTWDFMPTSHRIPFPIQDVLLAQICRTGRCLILPETETETATDELPRLAWDDGEPWALWLGVAPDPTRREYVVRGFLRRAEDRMALDAPLLLLAGGFVVTRERVARLDDGGAFAWISHLRQQGMVRVSTAQGPALVEAVLRLPRVPPFDLPAELRFEEVQAPPRPRLCVRQAPREWASNYLCGVLSFDYDGVVTDAEDPRAGIFQAERRRLVKRDRDAERGAADRLAQLGFRRPSYAVSAGKTTGLALNPRKLPRVVAALLANGWHVEADGKLYRHAGPIRIEVSSGVDWFELHGTVEFGDTVATLPALLAAVKRGERTVLLGDGTFGVLPEDWLAKYGALAGLGTPEDGHLRFGRTQVGVLDALLAALPDVACDEVFARARDELRTFDRIQPSDPPSSFGGTLRAYQRDGLGWLHFLRRFGFGGCLADDMGLGKTIQVLALLEARRAERKRDDSVSGATGAERKHPSLVVVPRSLVFNWKQEAARFTPDLRVLDHTGAGRARATDHFDAYDLVVTTYGTLRRDAVHLRDAPFDCVILDEAQAIKNADTETAKAARLLRADHRLALSGTPVQNHLGELWSLFEFLNPGMLGAASAFGLDGAGLRNPDPDTRQMLARALKPFVLRRTKDQVARDLPARLEQTLYCELEPDHRVEYDALREHYRQALLARVARDGVRRSAIQILEALLRLRQAACHPGLLDRARVPEPSAKLEVLLSRLAEVADEGHKALVFSQFTSFLAIVRDRLDRARVRYEYLDGRTRDRAAPVAHFQSDPDCRLFLVSLKAGGLGLNLTAAEYVFLLDPWWNPAVEAQAIDRTHRIGQTRPVFAYRLIARDTVEEKVLELQKTKRELADAIITADNSLIGTLNREDLERLLS